MPELPEVETTLRGIAPYLRGQIIREVVVRKRRLRWPITAGIGKKVCGQRVRNLRRRGKYILVEFARGGLLMHLGMSGSFRVVAREVAAQKHDHYDIVTAAGIVRYRDPRRFGCLLFTASELQNHRLIRDLGVEPLGDKFGGEYLHKISRGRGSTIKVFMMNSHIVVGVGNIYAAESLFIAGIHPARAAGKISRARYDKLATAVREVLAAAIRMGGTTIRDFAGADSSQGYFVQQLLVYGREGEKCKRCNATIRKITQAQRATYFCPRCQR